MDPKSTIHALSMIFTDSNENGDKKGKKDKKDSHAQFSPQAKIILLTIILCSTVLGMYTIFESFLDTMILAVLSGVAYVKLRQRFVTYLKKMEAEEIDTKATKTIIFENLIYLQIFLLLPWIRS